MLENFIMNTVLHEKCKNLEQYLYDKNLSILPKGTNLVNVGYKPNHPDFNYQVFKNGNTVFMVIKGTDTPFNEVPIENYQNDKTSLSKKFNNIKNDFKNDKDIYLGNIPAQTSDAFGLYEALKEQYPKKKGYDIVSVGYSLSGCTAQILHAVTGVPTVTFNPLGAKNLLPEELQHNSGDIVNYCNKNDGITMGNSRNHIGTCYTIDSNGSFNLPHLLASFEPLSNRKPFDNTKHYSLYNAIAEKLPKMEDFPDFNYIKEQTKNVIKTHQNPNKMNTPILKGKVEENVYYDGKTYTPIKGKSTGYAASLTDIQKQEIVDRYKSKDLFYGMSDDDILNNYINFEENKFFNPKNRVFYENEFNPALAPKGSNDNLGIQEMIRQYYDNDKHLPPKEELDERVRTGELVYVHDYTRADGTKVSGYYRAYPRG